MPSQCKDLCPRPKNTFDTATVINGFRVQRGPTALNGGATVSGGLTVADGVTSLNGGLKVVGGISGGLGVTGGLSADTTTTGFLVETPLVFPVTANGQTFTIPTSVSNVLFDGTGGPTPGVYTGTTANLPNGTVFGQQMTISAVGFNDPTAPPGGNDVSVNVAAYEAGLPVPVTATPAFTLSANANAFFPATTLVWYNAAGGARWVIVF